MKKRLLMAVLSCAALAAPAVAATPIDGVWRNPKNTVHVDIRACESGACGQVVWATQKARDDAREGSGKELIGMQLFRGLKPDDRGVFRGKVFVPDINKTFSGSAQLIDDRTLKAKGCFLPNVLCKTQNWVRVNGPGV